MRLSFLPMLLAATLVATAAAHADTVTINSTAGVTAFTFISGHGTANGTSGIAAAYTNGAYHAPIGSSQFISSTNTGGNTNNDEVDYTSTFTLLAGEAYTGTLSLLVDDYAGVLVNGVSILAPSTSVNFTNVTTINLLSSYFTAGANTITVQDFNGGQPAAVDYSATLNGTAVTPEPSSLVLLGTGVLGMVGAARRRFLA